MASLIDIIRSIEEGSLDASLDRISEAIKQRRHAIREKRILERLSKASSGDEFTINRKSYPVTMRDAVVRLKALDTDVGTAVVEVLSVATKVAADMVGQEIEVPVEYLLDID